MVVQKSRYTFKKAVFAENCRTRWRLKNYLHALYEGVALLLSARANVRPSLAILYMIEKALVRRARAFCVAAR